ncbi:hypothetical protein ACFE04_009909 [Oxalis oulophora]
MFHTNNFLLLPPKHQTTSIIATASRVFHSTIPNPQQNNNESQSATWTKTIHNLCTRHHNVNEAIRLLDDLRLRYNYSPSSLNLSSIIHALCHDNRFHEAHRRFTLSIAAGCVPDERTCNVLIAKLLSSKQPFITWHLITSLFNVKPDFVPNLVNYNRLIHQFCVLSRVNVAHMLLFDMRHRGHCPNVVTYTTLVDGYCRNGQMDSAFKVFEEMFECGLCPNSLTYSVLIRGVLKKRDVTYGLELMKQLWEHMKCEEDLSVNNAAFLNVIDSLCREGFVNEVFTIAEDMPQGKSVDEGFAYGHMIDSLCKSGRHHGASRIVYIMRKRGFVPSLSVYNSIVHGVCQDGPGGCMRAYQLLEEGKSFQYVPSEYTYKVVVENLCQYSDLEGAREVLQIMLSKKNVDKTRIYNIYLKALCFMNNPTELLNVLVHMLQMDCQPDVITMNTVINGLCKFERIEEAIKILDDMIIGKFCSPDVVTFTTIISGLLSSGRFEDALVLFFDVMPQKGVRPGVVTHNAVLRGLFKLKQSDKAMTIFNRMIVESVTADKATYAIVIDGLCECERVEEAKSFWNDVIWPSKIHDNYVYAAIIKGLCLLGKFNEACHFLYELVDSGVTPNNVCYNIVINSACTLGMKKEAYQIVKEMRNNGLAPDTVTWRILDKLHKNVTVQLSDDDSNLEL